MVIIIEIFHSLCYQVPNRNNLGYCNSDTLFTPINLYRISDIQPKY